MKFFHTILPAFQAPANHPYWRSPDKVNLSLKMAGNLAVDYFFTGGSGR